MPNAAKVAIVRELADKLSRQTSVIVADYRGLDVKAATELRRRLREAGAELKVAKNTLARLAAAEVNLPHLDPLLVGPSALAFGYDDPVIPAKVLSEFAKGHQALQIRGGVLAGRPVDADAVQRIAELPPRDVLLAQVCAGMQAPVAGLVGVLQGVVRKLVYALDAVRAQKETQGAAGGA